MLILITMNSIGFENEYQDLKLNKGFYGLLFFQRKKDDYMLNYKITFVKQGITYKWATVQYALQNGLSQLKML